MAKKGRKKAAGAGGPEAPAEPVAPPEPGDEVTLDVANAPAMTVVELRGANNAEALCRWFGTDGALHQHTFHLAELCSADEETKGAAFAHHSPEMPAVTPGQSSTSAPVPTTGEGAGTSQAGAEQVVTDEGREAAKATHKAEAHGHATTKPSHPHGGKK